MEKSDFIIDNRKQQKVGISSIFDLKLLKNVKNIKHIGAYCLILVLVVAIFGYFLIGKSNGKSADVETVVTDSAKSLEDSLQNVLSKIKGVGKVCVMISYDGSTEQVIAYNTTTSNDKSTSDGKVSEYINENKTPVVISKSGTSAPLVLKEIMPEIKGVIVVAEGGGNLKVRLDILSAVETVLNISADKVEVFTMNN